MTVSIRLAGRADLEVAIRLLSDDPLGARRERYEDPLPKSYLEAFDSIERDPNNELFVAVSGDKVIGLVQVTFIPNLSYQGMWRAQVEGVRISKQYQGKGIGHQLIQHVVGVAQQRNCGIVQLTADKSRQDAIRFYQQLGFRVTHEGLKLWL